MKGFPETNKSIAIAKVYYFQFFILNSPFLINLDISAEQSLPLLNNLLIDRRLYWLL